MTKPAWKVMEDTNHVCCLAGYQSKEYKKWPIVNAVTKATIPGWDDPILLWINYATIIDDPDEVESLVVHC